MKALSNYKSIFLSALVIGAVLLIYFILTAPTHHKKTRKTISSAESAQTQKLQKFNLSGFDNKGKRFWTLEGNTAKINLGETVLLEDDVTLRLEDGTLVKTDHVKWAQDTSILKTNAPVYVDRAGTKVYGTGAYGKLNENFIQLNHDIEMIISDTAKLNCLGPMKVFYNQNKMIFFRDVKVHDDRGSLSSWRMDVFFDENSKKIKEIVAVGNVSIKRGNDTTHSKRAIYIPATGAVRLEGSPEIILHKQAQEILNAPIGN